MIKKDLEKIYTEGMHIDFRLDKNDDIFLKISDEISENENDLSIPLIIIENGLLEIYSNDGERVFHGVLSDINIDGDSNAVLNIEATDPNGTQHSFSYNGKYITKHLSYNSEGKILSEDRYNYINGEEVGDYELDKIYSDEHLERIHSAFKESITGILRNRSGIPQHTDPLRALDLLKKEFDMLKSIEKPSDRTLHKMEVLKNIERRISNSNFKKYDRLYQNKTILKDIFKPYTSYNSMVKGISSYVAEQFGKEGSGFNPKQGDLKKNLSDKPTR